MDFLDSVFAGEAFEQVRELPLYQALYQSEERAFQELNNLKTPLSLCDSARCLRKAMLGGSVELFRQILENSAPGECTEQCCFPRHTPGWGIQCSGSLLTLAAMMDRPQQARLLLEHGYDVNGSGLVIAGYLQQENAGWNNVAPPYARFCGSAGSQIQLIRPGTNIGIGCVTPLAAALLCGSLRTAEVLLQRDNVWKGESSAVCRAAVMVLEGRASPALTKEQQNNQLEILRKIFCPDGKMLPDRDTLLRSVYLQPASFAEFCRTDTLRRQLESGLCTEKDARQMLEILDIDMWWRSKELERVKAGKLLLLKRYFPRLCREGWVTGIFLRETVRRIREDMPYKTMLDAWKQLCGKERDLTWAAGELCELNGKKRKLFFEEARRGGSLVMDADALSRWHSVSYSGMVEMLKSIRFRKRDGGGVSGLTQNLLLSGDLRLLQQAVKLGLLQQEDPRLLMEYLAETEQDRQDVRALVLTYARNQPEEAVELADWREPRRWNLWCQWLSSTETELQEMVQAFMQAEQSEEDCLRTMLALQQHLNRDLFAANMAVEHPQYPMLETDSLAGFACCAERGQAMALLLEHLPDQLLRVLRADWGERFFFRGTALTLAAALGRTEQVKLLLDADVDPDEVGRGDISHFFVRNADYSLDVYPVTPILAAILFGQRETANLLLEAGASCDFSRPEHVKVLMQGSAESLTLAESLPGVNFGKIPAEQLAALHTMTTEHGERTCFWKSLQQCVLGS